MCNEIKAYLKRKVNMPFVLFFKVYLVYAQKIIHHRSTLS
ncbi:hypothetical protein CCAN11_2350040 [Capnocytophaga canimorsus]|uniref:Uncharacterized protein n=1 Tax=Capnocytophaga canimorsus TaxID=28188 RepID=A0A0B7IIT6_9FLAO|nr:hypothetical protein CCAN11_2350040 [Capnocytophaga canimorsus]